MVDNTIAQSSLRSLDHHDASKKRNQTGSRLALIRASTCSFPSCLSIASSPSTTSTATMGKWEDSLSGAQARQPDLIPGAVFVDTQVSSETKCDGARRGRRVRAQHLPPLPPLRPNGDVYRAILSTRSGEVSYNRILLRITKTMEQTSTQPTCAFPSFFARSSETRSSVRQVYPTRVRTEQAEKGTGFR